MKRRTPSATDGAGAAPRSWVRGCPCQLQPCRKILPSSERPTSRLALMASLACSSGNFFPARSSVLWYWHHHACPCMQCFGSDYALKTRLLQGMLV